MRGIGAFTLVVVDVGVGSVDGMVSVGLHVFLQMQMSGQSEIEVTDMVIEVVGVFGVSSTSTNHERQSATLLQASDIHLNVISGKFQRPSVYFVVSTFKIKKFV